MSSVFTPKDLLFMQQRIEHELRDEDVQIIRDNQLGNPLRIYKQKPSFVQFYRGLNVVFTLLLIVALALFILVHLKNWYLSFTLPQEARPSSFLDDVVSFLAIMIPGLVMLLLLRSEVKRVRTARIIVCEHGLLLIEKRFRNWHIEVARWRDIQTIPQTKRSGILFLEYSLLRREGKAISISGYQHMEALISQIRQYSDEA